MTKEEAIKVAGIIKTADQGCSTCYTKLADTMQKQFPEFNWRELVETVSEIWPDEE